MDGGDLPAGARGEGLGLRLALDRSFEARRLRILFFRVGGVTVEVAARLGRKPASRGASAARGGAAPAEAPVDADRLLGLAWRVADADGARARIAASGFKASEVRDGRKPGTRVFTVGDGTCEVPTLILELSAVEST